MKKRTRAITLLLASSVVVAGCSPSAQTTRRGSYATLEDCQVQWGTGDEKCRTERDGVYGPHYIYSGGRGIFYPYTREGEVSTKPVEAPSTARFSPRGEVIGDGVRGVRTTSITRGGFGGLSGYFHGAFGHGRAGG